MPLLLLMATTAAAARQPEAKVAPIVEAERAFARAAAADGIGPAFRRFAAPDAILFAPDPAPAAARLGENPAGKLRWWPVYAGISASGDLGFTTGPYVLERASPRRGRFLTVWKRQPDGRWRWVIDHGISAGTDLPGEPELSLEACPEGRRWAASGSAADALGRAEARLAAELAVDAPSAFAAALAPDGRILRDGQLPAVGAAASAALLASGPRVVSASPLAAGLSKAGDLAFTYGNADWRDGATPVHGHYLRIWQHRARGWVLIVDETTPVPPG